jgi:TolA-binding protein
MYLLKNQLDQWETYAASVGFSESTAVADSTSYAVAAKFYNLGNCTEALVQANKYILKYPSGLYITEIHYMRGECSFKANDYATALGSYNAILDKGQTKYTEMALKRTGFIYYTQKDWVNASRMYKRLETESKNSGDQNDSKVNLMRCYLFLNNMDSANVYATKVLAVKGLPGDITGQANYIKGKFALDAGDNVNAEKYFKEVGTLAPNTSYAAEASYQLCYIRFMAKPSKQVETQILKHINDYDAFPDWSGEGWLLLADNHLALKDTAKARIVLNWYIENGDSPVHVKRAQDKIGVLDAAQNRPTERKQEELILPLGDPNDQKLFENGNGGDQ